MRVFLSYRRDDTAGRAGRIADVFTDALRRQQRVPGRQRGLAGPRLRPTVDAAIVDSDVMLVVIGRGWLTAREPTVSVASTRPDDFVRREVGAALTRGSAWCRCWSTEPNCRAEDLPDELAGMLTARR